MGMWVILIGGSDFTIEQFQNMDFTGNKEIIKSAHHIDIIYENGYAHFYDDTDRFIIGGYEQSELERLPFRKCRMIMLKYSNIQILRNILGADDFPQNIIIDCDGVDLGLDDIIEQERLLL